MNRRIKLPDHASQLRHVPIALALLALASRPIVAQESQSAIASSESVKTARVLRADKIDDQFRVGAERIEVLINLAEPAREAQHAVDLNDVRSAQQHRSRVAQRQQLLAAKMDPNRFQTKHQLENQATLWATVSREGLEALRNDPDVESIEPVETMQLHDVQGLPLMNAAATRAQFDGSGVAIAIVDTGVDYNHPQLGGGGFPNAKVLGGFDFGNNDADPAPGNEGHGTSCAGIAAGDLAQIGDYIGGVAPSAKIYALRVDRFDGVITNAALVSAWDWCVTHKNDDPNHPILIISMSIGGGRFFSNCDADEPSFAASARNAEAVGITILISSGNDGFGNSMGGPACLSNVISVGAVYDADVGSHIFQNCGDTTTAADQVTCYSNSASFLTLLAPSHDAFTTDLLAVGGFTDSFGGTSAACPYAAGGAAALQSAARARTGQFLTPAQVKQILAATGDSVFDPKAGLAKPRVNLARAIDSIGAVAPVPPPPGTDPVPAPGVDDALEDNDTPAAARLIQPGQHQLVGLDEDWFLLRLNRESDVDIRIAGPQGDLDLFAFDAQGAEIGRSESSSSSENLAGRLPVGDWLIAVAPFDGQTSVYTLTISAQSVVVPPSPSPTPTPVPTPPAPPAPTPPAPIPTPPCTSACGAGCAVPMAALVAGLFSGTLRRRRIR